MPEDVKPEPRQLSKSAIPALATLLHFHWFTQFRKSQLSQKKLSSEIGITSTELNNFLRQGAPGKEGVASAKIVTYLKRIFLDEHDLDDMPDYIRRACSKAFEDEPSIAVLRRGDVGTVFSDCAKGTSDQTWGTINTLYAGCYDVYRYAARVIPGDPPTRQTEGDGTQKTVSNAIRAALQIFPRGKGQDFPRFVLNYNPEKVVDDFPPRTSSGSVIVVNQNLHFVGKEESFTRPVYMVCKFNPVSSQEFKGLVIRQHDGVETPFASRVYFRRNDDVQNIDELNDQLGVLSEEDLPEDVKDKRKFFLNDTDFNGKGALVLG